jgi:lipopolysaccharide export LptBFGC system permease protein LptF
MKICRLIVLAVAVSCLMTTFVWAQGNQQNTQAMADLMRKDLRAQKQSIIDQAMELEAAQKAVFWGVYDKYQKELELIWNQRLANIKKYAENYTGMTDAVADELAAKMLDIEGQRNVLKKKYYAEFKAKMGSRVAGRFLMAETALGNLIDLQLASEIPLIK